MSLLSNSPKLRDRDSCPACLERLRVGSAGHQPCFPGSLLANLPPSRLDGAGDGDVGTARAQAALRSVPCAQAPGLRRSAVVGAEASEASTSLAARDAGSAGLRVGSGARSVGRGAPCPWQRGFCGTGGFTSSTLLRSAGSSHPGRVPACGQRADRTAVPQDGGSSC